MSVAKQDLETFSEALNGAVKNRVNEQVTEQVFGVDGEIPDAGLTLALAETLRQGGAWWQQFPEPVFVGVFAVKNARIVGQKHVKFELETLSNNRRIDAIYFNPEKPDALIGLAKVNLVYQLDINYYQGRSSTQLMVRHAESN